MSSVAMSRTKQTDWSGAAEWIILALLVIVVVGAICAYFFGGGWAKHEADARAHAAQQVVDIRGAGFTHFDGYDTGGTYEYGESSFTYQVGSCPMPIGVDTVNGHYKPFIRLTGVSGAIIYVTMKKLRTLPQTKHCFG